MQNKSTVLVTGASGFIGSNCVLALLKKGYSVRATVRSQLRIEQLQALIKAHYSDNPDIEYVTATLDSDEGWDAAVKGCESVLHLASPLPVKQPKDPNELIIPARDGALRVLAAATPEGVKRVVMTSSTAAVNGSRSTNKDYIYDEKDWTDLNDKTLTPYKQSKTIAEKAAWEFVNKDKSIELTTICPSLVCGPALEAKVNSSLEVVKRLMDGSFPIIPPIGFGVVDVRDVADLHVLAMEKPEAAGNRFIGSSDFMWMHEIAATLRNHFGEEALKVPTLKAPAWFLRLLALRDPAINTIVPDLNQRRRVSNETSKRLLGWTPRTTEEAVISTAKSLLAYGLLYK
ncbi:MAG: aldehyde reductase [Cyanobacteria bacterium J06635_10]